MAGGGMTGVGMEVRVLDVGYDGEQFVLRCHGCGMECVRAAADIRIAAGNSGCGSIGGIQGTVELLTGGGGDGR